VKRGAEIREEKKQERRNRKNRTRTQKKLLKDKKKREGNLKKRAWGKANKEQRNEQEVDKNIRTEKKGSGIAFGKKKGYHLNPTGKKRRKDPLMRGGGLHAGKTK